MISRQRLQFALEQLKPTDWKIFEEFASEFLASDYPNLQTVGGTGDRGRDAELFSTKGDPSVYIQYSVSAGWSDKITQTARRLKEEFPDALVLVYATNQDIGTKADALKVKIRKSYQIFLDLRDKNWFLERRSSTSQTLSASDYLTRSIVDPIVISREVIQHQALGLSEIEARAALLYLDLQWEDDTREKGLTKLCFEALVRTALRETDSENRLPRSTIHQHVRSILNTHPPDKVDIYTDSALNRLSKRVVRHWKQRDEFCLSHDERERLKDRLLELKEADTKLLEEIRSIVVKNSRHVGVSLNEAQTAAVTERLKRVVERTLLGRGELFVSAVKSGSHPTSIENIEEAAVSDLSDNPDNNNIGPLLIPLVTYSTQELLSSPPDASYKYLRSLGDTYTLMAFLRETPDVQSAITKMFSQGTIWLDTNIALPLFGEELAEGSGRRFQNLLNAARELGMRLRITSGVLEEIERHMNRCLVFVRSQTEWEGEAPFLVILFAASGRPLGKFASWLELFRGDQRPEDDIRDYMSRFYGIEVEDLDINQADPELRETIQEIFYARRERQAEERYLDQITMTRLAIHDVENYLGVILKRRREKPGPFGFTAWWLTLDRGAYLLESELRNRLSQNVPNTPVMSPDFLSSYLSFAPMRGRLSKTTEAKLPLSLGLMALDFAPSDLLALAEQRRVEMSHLPAHVIDRRIRDQIDAAKARKGILVSGGLAGVQQVLAREISDRQKMD